MVVQAADQEIAAQADVRSEIIARLERLPFSRFHLRLAAILGVGTFFDAFDAQIIGIVMPVIGATLHIGLTNVGMVISAAFIGQFIGAWAFGYLSEAVGRKPAFVIALLIFGTMSIASAFAWNFQSLALMRVVQGLGLGGEVPLAGALFGEYLRSANRGRVALIYQSLFVWGGVLTPAISLGVFALFDKDPGWRVLFVLGGIPVLVAIVACYALPESVRWLADHDRFREADKIVGGIEAEPRRRPLPAPQVKQLPPVRKTRVRELFSGPYARRTSLLWIQWAATYFVAYGYSAWLPTLYVRIGGLPVNDALILTLLTWSVTLTTHYTECYLTEKTGRKPLFIAGFSFIVLGTAVGTVSIILFHMTGWPVLFGSALIIGMGTAMNGSALYNYTVELYPTRMRALGVASGSSMARLASICSPTAVGILLDANYGIQSVLIMFGIVGVIGLTNLSLRAIETKGRLLEELSP